MTVSKIVPTMWNELSTLGPGVRGRRPARARRSPTCERVVLVLVGDAVEDHEVGRRARRPSAFVEARPARPAGRGTTRSGRARTPRRPCGRPSVGSTMTMPYMPLAMWWSAGAVPQWYIQTPGVVGRPLVELLLAGVDRGHLVVPGDLAGVEVDRVRQLVLGRVLEVDADRVADLDPDDRARERCRRRSRPSATKPVGDGHLLLLDDAGRCRGLCRAGAAGRRGVVERVRRARSGRRRRRRSGAGPPWSSAARRRPRRPSTVIAPFMPGLGVAGDRADERQPAGRDVDRRRARSAPAAAAIVVPSANVTSWRVAPVLLSVDLVRAGRGDRRRSPA